MKQDFIIKQNKKLNNFCYRKINDNVVLAQFSQPFYPHRTF